MDVVITGIGLQSALGNLSQTWQQLLLGQSGIQMIRPFPQHPAMPLGLFATTPMSDLRTLTEAVLMDAIADAGLALPQPTCGVVVGSSRGNQTLLEQYLRGEHSLSEWLAALPNIAAVTTAHMLRTQAIVLAPMAACATGISAIARGAELIAAGECHRVIAGAVETPVTRLTLAGFAQMGALAKTGAYPFDVDREGFVLGEGGAFLVLESGALARDRGARVYGRVVGFGLSADAYHISAPDPLGTGAKAAIEQALKHGQLMPRAINYIHAHGTATQLNDATEASVIREIFGDRPWVSSTKGATGHTLGGSGALGAAFCLMSLKTQIVPSCIGLKNLEFPIRTAQTATLTTVNYALCNGFGFGGQNGAIILGRAA